MRALQDDLLKSSGAGIGPSRARINSALRAEGSFSASSVVALGKRKVRCLVILAAFADHWDETNKTVLKDFGHPPEAYERLCNEEGYSEDGAKGSVRDFYLENSYGNLTIDFSVLGWVKMPEKEEWYGDNEHERTRMRQMVVEAINAVDEAGYDLAQADGDGDFYVDLVHVIHSGYTETQIGNPSSYVWDFAWAMSGRLWIDEVGISTYSYNAALRGSKRASPPITGIGPICHEIGHQLGLPDLYDAGDWTHGVGTWCTMGTGSWGASITSDGRQPVHLSARCKQLLGFVTPKIMHSQNEIEIRSVEDHPEVHLIRDGSANEHEYFLIENRQRIGFDSQLPGGLLIWHVRNDILKNDSSRFSHPSVRLEEARGEDLLANRASAASSQTWRAGNGLAGGFHDLTGDPDSNAMLYQVGSNYDRTNNPASYTRIRIRNFSASGPTMTYDLQTVVPTVFLPPTATGTVSLAWAPASDASFYEVQEGRVATNTVFSDGAEDSNSLFEDWITTGVTRRSDENARSGTYSYMLAMRNEDDELANSRVQSMELRRAFAITPAVRLSFWMKSHITAGRGFLRAEVSVDNGETWRRLAELSGFIDPWEEITLEAAHFQALGILPGESCRLRFLVHIPDIWGWGEYPRYGFAIDDIALTGIEIQEAGGWRTVAENVTDTFLPLGEKPPGQYNYRVRALVEGQWQSYSPPGLITAMPANYGRWAEILPPGERSETADPDGDGVANFVEYALGREAQSAAAADGAAQLPLGEIIQVSDRVQFALRVDLPEFAPADVLYTIHAASQLEGPWSVVASKNGTDPWIGSMRIETGPPQNARQQHVFIEDLPESGLYRFFRFGVSQRNP